MMQPGSVGAARTLRRELITARTGTLAAGSIVAGAGAILAGVGLMASSGFLVSRASERPLVVDLMLVFVAVRFFGLARPALRYVERLVSHELTFRLLLVIRRWFLEALLPLSHGQLAAFRSGDLLSRLAADVDALQEAYLRVIAPAVVAVVVSIVVVTALAVIDPALALITLVLLTFNGVVWSWIAHRHSRRLASRRNDQRRRQSADLVMVLQGLEDVLAFGHEQAALARFADGQRRIDSAEASDGRQLAVHATVGAAISALSFFCVLVVALRGVALGELPPVWIAALVLATVAAFESVEGLPAAWQFAGQTRDSARRVGEIVRTVPAVRDATDAVRPRFDCVPAIDFHNVSFGYGHHLVLRDVSFRIAPGQHVAVVGPTGAGKTTLLSLLTRGWDPSAGFITLDDVDLRRILLDDLRRHLAVMPQQVHVFNDTLRDNVRLARPGASDQDVIDALRRARLGEFVDGLPAGLDTMLGEHGARMSAGERQRLGFARVLLTDAALVIVDEPTANLDAARERQMLEELSRWARGRTLVMISHRPTALDFVDRVLHVADGRVSEDVAERTSR